MLIRIRIMVILVIIVTILIWNMIARQQVNLFGGILWA